MPKRKLEYHAHPKWKKSVFANLSIHPTSKDRGHRVARSLGYDFSGLVETFVDRLHEAWVLKRDWHPGGYLQVTIFDRLPVKQKSVKTKKRRPGKGTA